MSYFDPGRTCHLQFLGKFPGGQSRFRFPLQALPSHSGLGGVSAVTHVHGFVTPQ